MGTYIKEMISFPKAMEIVQAVPLQLLKEEVLLAGAFNRVLAEDVISDMNMPPFDKSAMDGFACRKEDLDGPLALIGEIAAGAIPPGPVRKGQCMRIMTGAMLPPGADYVLVKEEAQMVSTGIFEAVNPGKSSNICFTGEDCRNGDLLIVRGTLIKPQHVAVLAAAGYSMVEVYCRPSVTVISTGNELVEASSFPSQAKIRNSNGPQLVAQLAAAGIQANYAGIIGDDAEKIRNQLKAVMESYQLILISGGVSVGDYDFIPQVLTESGVDIHFHGMHARPGKHLLFGQKGDAFIFGLPGNPVSSFVQFELLVKPLLCRMQGLNGTLPEIAIHLGSDYKRKKAGTLQFVPAQISREGTVNPLEYHGSAHIHAYIEANGIMAISEDTLELKAGEKVYVRPI